MDNAGLVGNREHGDVCLMTPVRQMSPSEADLDLRSESGTKVINSPSSTLSKLAGMNRAQIHRRPAQNRLHRVFYNKFRQYPI